MTIEQMATRFNCTPAQVRELFARNAADLGRMAEKAERTGKKVGGYDAAQLRHHQAVMAARSME